MKKKILILCVIIAILIAAAKNPKTEASMLLEDVIEFELEQQFHIPRKVTKEIIDNLNHEACTVA